MTQLDNWLSIQIIGKTKEGYQVKSTSKTAFGTRTREEIEVAQLYGKKPSEVVTVGPVRVFRLPEMESAGYAEIIIVTVETANTS